MTIILYPEEDCRMLYDVYLHVNGTSVEEDPYLIIFDDAFGFDPPSIVGTVVLEVIHTIQTRLYYTPGQTPRIPLHFVPELIDNRILV